MVHEWYYGQGEAKNGPFTSKQLIDLARHGIVLPTDTVWRGDNNQGVAAAKVKNLFAKKDVLQDLPNVLPVVGSVSVAPPPQEQWPQLQPLSPIGVMDEPIVTAALPPTPSLDTLVARGAMPGLRPLSPLGVVDPDEAEVAPTPPVVPVLPPPAPRKARAIAGKGAIIIGQDGKTVKFKGKCTTCNYEAAGYQSMTIPRGAYRTTFFCNKCRKQRDVELQGMQ